MNTTDFVACIGLDWADEKHDFCLTINGADFELGRIEHSPNAINLWAQELNKRFDGQPIVICVELNIGPIISCLQKYSFITIKHIPPKISAKYREAFSQSGAKDDPTDAYLHLDYLLKHGDVLHEVTLDTIDTRLIQQLVKHRRRYQDLKGDVVRRIRAKLKCYYPIVLDLFDDLDTYVFCDFIEEYPDLETLVHTPSCAFLQFLTSHHSSNKQRNESRLQLIAEALPLTEDQGVIIPNRMYVLSQVKILRQYLDIVKSYDCELGKLFEKHEDREIFESLPGAGEVMAPRLLAVFGTDRTNFASAEEVSNMTGIAPVTKRSGKKAIVHKRCQCEKFKRQTFVEWAWQTVKKSFWARSFYEQKKAEGKEHQVILRALAFKWIRIVYSCWKNKTPYDETKYLLKMRERGNVFALPK